MGLEDVSRFDSKIVSDLEIFVFFRPVCPPLRPPRARRDIPRVGLPTLEVVGMELVDPGVLVSRI